MNIQVAQAVVKANSQSNGKDQILTPWGSETPELISMTHMQIHVTLRQRGCSGRTREKTRVVVS